MTKPNFILDLDQTIISGESIRKFDMEKHGQRMKLFRYKTMDDDYHIFERPHLQKFLDFLFDNFNVSIWTAASKDYALFIIENIIIGRKKKSRIIDYIFFSYHCDMSDKYKKSSKNLEMLWDIYKLTTYNKQNTIILDDYDEVFDTQTKNCIIAIPFEFTDDNSEKDKFLLTLKRKIKSMMKTGRFKSDNVNSCVPEINKYIKK